MKKALSAVLAVVLVLGVCFSVPMIASANNGAESFTYELDYDNEGNPLGYIITGVSANVEGAVEIPATYQPGEDINLGITYPNKDEAPEGSYDITTVAVDSEAATVEGATITLKVDGTEVDYAAAGATVTVTAEKEGYVVSSITVTETEGATAVEFNTVEGTFAMPEAAVTVTVVFVEATYKVTVIQPTEGGSITASPVADLKAGDVVTLTNTPNEGYNFGSYDVKDEEDATVAVTGDKFTMPASDVTVTATFSEITYNIEVLDSENGTVTAQAAAAEGDTVTVTVDPEGGYALKTLKYKYNDGENDQTKDVSVSESGVYSFVMPKYNVQIEATFDQLFAINGVNNVTGKVTPSVTSAIAGEKFTLDVEPAEGYKLEDGTLKVAYTGAEGEETLTADAEGKYTMPAAAVTVTATFEAIEYEAKVDDTIINGTVAIKKVIRDESEEITDFKKLNIGDTVTLELTINKGCELAKDSLVVSYTDGDETKYVEYDENYTFSMPAADIEITAKFIPSELNVIGIAEDAFQGESAKNITAFTVADGQDLFVAEDGVLFKVVEGDTADTLTLFAFPASYKVEVKDDEEATYTIPASVTVEGPEDGAADDVTYAVTAVADGAFQALGNVTSVFCEGTVTIKESAQPAFGSMSDDETPVFDSNKKFHTTTGHTPDDGTETTAPTCTVPGVETIKCEDCGRVLDTDEIPVDADAHSWGDDADAEWVRVIEATCLQQGSSQRVCDYCDYTERRYDAKLTEHNWSTEFTVDVEAECEKVGSKSKHCLTLGCTATTDVTEIEALEHEITGDNRTEYTAPECGKVGSVSGTCDHCKVEMTLELDALVCGSELNEVIDFEATCEEKGLMHYECKYCGKKGASEEIDALEHSDPSEVKWTIDEEATCTEDGSMAKYCENCGEVLEDADGNEYKRVIAAEGHNYDDEKWEVVTPATCQAKGSEKNACTVCKEETTREIAKSTTHAFPEVDADEDDVLDDSNWTEDEPATCKKVGKESRHCTVEGCTEKTDVRDITILTHTADDTWEVTTEATCYRAGVKTGECTVCEQEDVTIVIPMLAHDFGDLEDIKENTTVTRPKLDEDGEPVLGDNNEPVLETLKAATCTKAGFKVKYCQNENCTAYDEITEQEAYGHKKATEAELKDYNDKLPEGTEKVVLDEDTDPTCTEVGHDYEFCLTCKQPYDTEIDALGHDWADEATNLETAITVEDEYHDEIVYGVASCKGKGTDGYAAIFCQTEGCGAYKPDSFVKVAAPSHEPSVQWSLVSEATCIRPRVESNTCKNCKDSYEVEVGTVADHDWAEAQTVVSTQSCTTDGLSYYKCNTAGCEARKDEVKLDATGHNFATAERIAELNGDKAETDEDYIDVPEDVAATCEKAGKDYGYCETCNDVVFVEIDALGHLFADKYTELEAPTCKKPGSKARKCIHGCNETTEPVTVAKLDHVWETEYSTDKEPTCSEEGAKSIHCSLCDASKEGTTVVLKKVDHTYDENSWATIKIATCFETGLQENFCSVCNKDGLKEGNKVDGYTTKVLEKKEHTWSDDISTDPASCTETGSRYKTCTRVYKIDDEYVPCTGTYEVAVIPATGHILDEEAEDFDTVDPTCEEGGYDYGTCTNEGCTVAAGEAQANFTSALGHDWSGTPVYVAPTCTEAGSKTAVCNRTGCAQKGEDGKSVQVIPATGHQFEGAEWEVVDGVDCTTSGSKIQKCTVEGCDGVNPGIVAEEHAETEWKITKKATCTEAGEMVERCVACKTVISEEPEEIPAKGHSIVETVITPATCSADGVKSEKCTVCDYEDNEIAIPASEDYHDFTEWRVLVEPTCTEKGENFRYCKICQISEFEKPLKKGHVYGDYIIDEPATCEATGKQHKECTVCGYETITDADTIPALRHNYVGNTCANNCGAKIYEYEQYGDDENEIIITKYNGSIAYDESKADETTYELYVPAEIDGKTVKAIGDNAFMMFVESEDNDGNKTVTAQTTGLTTVFIPDSVESIGDFAFANSKLKAVTLSANVTEIGKYAFGYTATAAYEEVVDTETEATPAPATEEGDETTEEEPVYELKLTAGALVDDFTIYGEKGSAAQAYAKDSDADEETTETIKFVYLSKVYAIEPDNDYIKVVDDVIFVDSYELDETTGEVKGSEEDQLKAMITAKTNSTGAYEVEAMPNNVVNDTVKFFGTGSTLRVVDAYGVVIEEVTIVIKGDVNGDSVCDAIDCMLLQLAITNSDFALEGAYYTAANSQVDSQVDINDFNQMVNQIFGETIIKDSVEESTTEAESTSAATTTEPSTEESTEPSTEESTEPSTEESTEDESESVSVSESTPAASESTPDVSESTPDVSESTPDVSESTPDVSESTPDASEPTGEVA